MLARDAAARRKACCLCSLLGVVVTFALGSGSALAQTASSVSPVGVHSMVFINLPFSAKEAMFKEAAAMGASTIRLDIQLSGVFVNSATQPDWTWVDQDMVLARRYHLAVLADLTATPYYMAQCPAGTPSDKTYMCPGDPAQWAYEAGQIAAHTRGVINNFEIINEPDGKWAFLGTPQQYAGILSAAYDAIHAANPSARVALGGLMDVGAAGRAWLNAVFATPGADAAHKFDIANLHIRTSASEVASVVKSWRQYFAAKGFTGPLWVTETGYPADPAYQTDPEYQGGPSAQARWLTTVIPAMLNAGADMVFVTERDQQTGRFDSEGVLQTPNPLPAFPTYTCRPSFYAVRNLISQLMTHTTSVLNQRRINHEA